MAGLSVRNRPENLNGALEWLNVLQKEQMDSFIAQGLPSKKIEDLHYTDISGIKNHPLTFPKETQLDGITDFNLNNESHLCVFVNGYFNLALSRIQDLPKGVILSSIRDILKKQPDLI